MKTFEIESDENATAYRTACADGTEPPAPSRPCADPNRTIPTSISQTEDEPATLIDQADSTVGNITVTSVARGEDSTASNAQPDSTEDDADKTTPADGFTVDNLLATVKGMKSELSDLSVEEVDHADSAVILAPALIGKFDRVRAQLLAAGLTPDQVEKALAIKMVNAKGQRQLPLNVIVTSTAMLTFFVDRSDEQLEIDMIKGIRNDGGPYGPAGMYERVLVQQGVDADVAKPTAEALAAKVGHRIMAIRTNVVATINELRRRRAVAAGVNPADAKYLRVR
jgi:hypothetical protein